MSLSALFSLSPLCNPSVNPWLCLENTSLIHGFPPPPLPPAGARHHHCLAGFLPLSPHWPPCSPCSLQSQMTLVKPTSECAPPLLETLQWLPSLTQKTFQGPCHDPEDPTGPVPYPVCSLLLIPLQPQQQPLGPAMPLPRPLLSLSPLPRRFSPRSSHGNELHCHAQVFGTDATIPERPSRGNQHTPPSLFPPPPPMWHFPRLQFASCPPLERKFCEDRDCVCLSTALFSAPGSGFVQSARDSYQCC